MKKNVRRWLALCLALVLVLSMAVMASAASMTFTQGGVTYTIAAYRSNRNDIKTKVDSTGHPHFYGNPTGVWLSGTYSARREAGIGGNIGVYVDYLHNVMNSEGIMDEYTANYQTNGEWIYMDPDLATGTYYLKMKLKCYNGTWTLSEGISLASAGAEVTSSGGSITSAPTGEWEFVFE